MNPQLDSAVSKLTGGFYTLAILFIGLAIFAALVGTGGGKNRKQKRATADLVWTVGLLQIALLVLPKLFR
jgi:hypothetical protein